MRITMTRALLAALLSAPAWGQQDPAFAAYQAQLAAAEKSLRLGETREVRRWLDTADPELRGWEWDHLHSITDTTTRRVQRSTTPVRVAVSPDGGRVATVEGDTVRILTWPGLEAESSIEGHGDAVYRAEFSPDGARLITVSRDVTARVWDLASGEEISRMELANPAFAAVAFDGTGERAATCAWERDDAGLVHGVVWVWDPATGSVLHRERVGVKPLSSVRFVPGGGGLVVGSWDGIVHVLDAQARETERLVLPAEGVYNAVDDVAVSPDGALVAAGSKDRTSRVFSLSSGELVATLRGHGGYVEGVEFSPDGATLATASADTTVALWDTGGWERRRLLRGAGDTVRGAAWADGGERLVACALDGELIIWAADTDDDSADEIRTGQNGIYSCALDPASDDMAVACFDGWVRVYDSRSGELRREWEAHPGSTCHAAAFSADGQRLVTCSWDHSARVWDPASGREIARLEAADGVYSTAISPSGTLVALSGGALEVWEVDRVERRHRFEVEAAAPRRVQFSPDGGLVAAGWSDGYARVYDALDGTLVATLGTGEGTVETVAFLPGGDQLVTGDTRGVVRLFPSRGGPAAFSIDTGGRGVNEVACSADRIAAGTDQLWLIDPERGGLTLGLSPQNDTLWSLCWSRDGERLATCAIAGTVKVLRR